MITWLLDVWIAYWQWFATGWLVAATLTGLAIGAAIRGRDHQVPGRWDKHLIVTTKDTR